MTGDALVAKAQKALVEAGEQWTNMRKDVFVELARHDKPASAYLIADNLSQARGKRVAANSVYRILDLFVASNLANKIESSNAYLANAHPGEQHDCIYLVCDGCGEASHVDDEMISGKLRSLAASNAFQAQRPVLEIRGLCAQCAPRAA